MDTIRITDRLSIPEAELKFTASRSSGPGGQNVNKVSTRVTLWFDVDDSKSLSVKQKARVRTALSTRISKAGILMISSQRQRSQAANRHAAVGRFTELVTDALRDVIPRKKTAPTDAARQHRMDAKRRRSEIKRQRIKYASSNECLQ